MHENILKEVV